MSILEQKGEIAAPEGTQTELGIDEGDALWEGRGLWDEGDALWEGKEG